MLQRSKLRTHRSLVFWPSIADSAPRSWCRRLCSHHRTDRAPPQKAKPEDPAVVCVDPAGRFAIPLLGALGPWRIPRRGLARRLGGKSGAERSTGAAVALDLDCFGRTGAARAAAIGWVMKAARGRGPELQQGGRPDPLQRWTRAGRAQATTWSGPFRCTSATARAQVAAGTALLWLRDSAVAETRASALLVRACRSGPQRAPTGARKRAGLASVDRKG